MAKCFGCLKLFFNAVAFVAEIKGRADGGKDGKPTSFGDALVFLKKRYGRKVTIPDALYEKVRDHEVYQNFKRKLVTFFCDQLLEAVIHYPNLYVEGEGGRNLEYARPAVEYLMTRRLGDNAPNELRPADEKPDEEHPADPWNVFPAICSNQLLGVLPPQADVAAHFGHESEEYKFFTQYFAQFIQGFTFVGFLVFPMHDEPDSIARLKLRAPSKEKKVVFVDDNYEAELGGFRVCYGLHYYRTMLGMQGQNNFLETVAVVEGEFDALEHRAADPAPVRRLRYFRSRRRVVTNPSTA